MSALMQFHSFFDDAAIFPPGLAPLERAVVEHIARLDKPIAQFVGPLILPIDKLEEAAQYTNDHVLKVSVVLNTDQLDLFYRLMDELPTIDIVAIEVKNTEGNNQWLQQLGEVRRRFSQISIFMELPADLVTSENMAELCAVDAGLKFRTGGIRQDLFPTPEELIRVLSTAVHADIPFKLTAGLHRALRYTDQNKGFQHFGFINIAAALEALSAGKGEENALQALNSDDGQSLAHIVENGGAWRESFKSFGTCSVREPLETLEDIELLDLSNN